MISQGRKPRQKLFYNLNPYQIKLWSNMNTYFTMQPPERSQVQHNYSKNISIVTEKKTSNIKQWANASMSKPKATEKFDDLLQSGLS